MALLRAAQLPQPDFNACVEGFEVDALWRRERVVLEFDSYAFHATRAAFERDRRRTAALQRARHVVLRTTWNELTRESHALIARTAEALVAQRPLADGIASSRRPLTPSLRKTLRTCVRTVSTLIESAIGDLGVRAAELELVEDVGLARRQDVGQQAAAGGRRRRVRQHVQPARGEVDRVEHVAALRPACRGRPSRPSASSCAHSPGVGWLASTISRVAG